MALDLTLSLAERKPSHGEFDIMDMDIEPAGKPVADQVDDAAARTGFVGEIFESSSMFQACYESLQSVFFRMQSSVNTANAPVTETSVATDGTTNKAATARPFLVPNEGR